MSRSASELYYQHSGRLGFAPLLILFLGMPIIALLAAAYSYLVVWCPVIGYVNILFLGGFILASSFVLTTLARIGNSRSPIAMALLGLACGFVAIYSAWLFFVKALFEDQVSLIDLVTNPVAFGNAVYFINQQGWWQPSGLAQWALSAIESGAVLIGLTMAGWSATDREVFCEDCGQWCEPFETMRLAPTEALLSVSSDQLKPEELLTLEDCTESDFPRFDAEVLQCNRCKGLQAIRFDQVSQVMDDGELKEKREGIPGVLIQRGDFG
jgi:hypothetical protein